MRRRILMCLAVLLLLSGMGAASASDVLAAQSEALDLDALQDAAGGYLPDGALEAGISLDEGLQTILNTGSGQISGVVRKAVRSGVLLLTVVLLCGLAEGLYGGMGVSQTTDVVAIVGALAITAVAVADANSLIGMGREALEQMETFSKILLPTITAAAAAAGSPSGAVARQLATMLFSDILITLINRLLLPLVYTYIAACVAYAAVGNEGLKRIAGTLKWVVTSILTVVLLVFVGYLTVSGVIAGSTDAVTVKAAKFTMSSLVPVVGGILSDAAETVLAGAGILKNAVGVFGMLAVLCMCVAPFLQLGIHYLTYKVTSALSATVSSGRVAGLIDQIGGASAGTWDDRSQRPAAAHLHGFRHYGGGEVGAMLELIRHWLVGITCAAMLVALAESLIPAGSIRRIARLTGGLVLLAAILNPLLKLDTTALTRALTEYKLELSAYSADLEEENEILMKDIIEEQSGAYIQDKAAAWASTASYGGGGREEEWPIPQSVTVMGSLTAEQQEALERTIEEDFAIPAERQRYESGDEE